MTFLLFFSADLAGLGGGWLAWPGGGWERDPGLFYYQDYPGTIWELSGILPYGPTCPAGLAWPCWPGWPGLLAWLAWLGWLACLVLASLARVVCEHAHSICFFLAPNPIGYNKL